MRVVVAENAAILVAFDADVVAVQLSPDKGPPRSSLDFELLHDIHEDAVLTPNPPCDSQTWEVTEHHWIEVVFDDEPLVLQPIQMAIVDVQVVFE